MGQRTLVPDADEVVLDQLMVEGRSRLVNASGHKNGTSETSWRISTGDRLAEHSCESVSASAGVPQNVPYHVRPNAPNQYFTLPIMSASVRA